MWQKSHGQHDALMKQCASFGELLHSFESSAAFTLVNLNELKAAWGELHRELLEHLAIEEEEYPPVLLKYGWEEVQKCEAKIQAHVEAGDPRGLGMILQAAGIDISGSGISEGWTTGRMGGAENESRIAGFRDAPWPVRNCCCLFPKFLALYEHSKASLVSIATMSDEDHDLPGEPVCGPCCVVS